MSTDFIRELKERTNIADVVGEYVRLRKTGTNYMGQCPFHADRSPSFSVSDKKGIYHCFGCQKGGDVISFIQEIQTVSFPEAVRYLAYRINMKVPPEFQARGDGTRAAGGEANPEARLEVYYKLNRFVAQFYHEKLLSPAGAAARDYLTRRGVSDQTVKTAYLGYAPAEWAELYAFLEEKKAPLNVAEELGLIRKKSTGAGADGRSHYDLFRDRVIFPVVDTRGRVIAFGARAMGDSDGPKYLNSSESPIYTKGNHLFGLFAAQKDVRAEDQCVVVEGFMDCLALQQAGIGQTVATLGTALTEKQVAILKRMTRNVVVLFDGDDAGKEAQLRAMEAFLEADVVVRGITLPDELDPDEFIQERGVDTLKSLLSNAPFVLDQQILELLEKAGPQTEPRARALDRILPWVAKISADTVRLVRLQELGTLFGMPINLLEKRIRELRPVKKVTVNAPAAVTRPGAPRPAVQPLGSTARRVLASGPNRPQPALKADALDLKLIDALVRNGELAGLIRDTTAVLEGVENDTVNALATKMFNSLASGQGGSLGEQALMWTDSPELQTVIRAAMMLSERSVSATGEERELLVTEIKDLEKRLRRRGLERHKANLRAELLRAEGSGKTEDYARLMGQYEELVRRLDESVQEDR